ncbi:MAG: lysophospholipase L1-like esterase [Bacteroidia bacterium]|jgi:lysophospholipase L1-like esterase
MVLMESNRPQTNNPQWCFYIILATLPLLIPLTITEIYLRIDGGFDTYAEKTGNPYRSYYNLEPPSLYWNHPINATYTINQGDFSYEYETNELGLREKRNAISRPDTSAFRILTLGDSFTEGFGAVTDSAWPRVLQTSFETAISHSKKIQVYNAGMAGSDPFFNYRMLKDKLLPFTPNLIIQTINTSDLSDYLFRGGMNRFRENKVVFRKGPWWELLYRFSYTFRLFSHSVLNRNFMLVTSETTSRIYDEAIGEYLSLFTQDYRELAEKFGFSVVYVIQPMPSDLRFAGDNYHRLMELYSLLKKNNEVSVDLLEPMSETIGKDSTFKYSWKIDGHYNGRGYNVMGSAIADSLLKMIPTQESSPCCF